MLLMMNPRKMYRPMDHEMHQAGIKGFVGFCGLAPDHPGIHHDLAG